MSSHMVSYIILGLMIIIAVAAIFVDKLTSEMEKARVLLYSENDFSTESRETRVTSTEYTNIPQNIRQKRNIGTLCSSEKIVSLEEYRRLHS